MTAITSLSLIAALLHNGTGPYMTSLKVVPFNAEIDLVLARGGELEFASEIKRSSAPTGSNETRFYAVALIDYRGAAIAGNKFRMVFRRGGRNQCIVGSATQYSMLGEIGNEVSVGARAQTQKRLWKPRDDEIAHNLASHPVRGGQSREHRIRLEGAVLDQAQARIQHAARRVMPFVPGRKRGNHQARVRGFHRRTRSNVSRTCSAVSTGRSLSATATTPLPRFSSRTGVAATSIISRPSPARISSG